jgi:hypothetical protein
MRHVVKYTAAAAFSQRPRSPTGEELRKHFVKWQLFFFKKSTLLIFLPCSLYYGSIMTTIRNIITTITPPTVTTITTTAYARTMKTLVYVSLLWRNSVTQLILLHPNTKRREPGERCHTITMMHRKPVKVSNECTSCAD